MERAMAPLLNRSTHVRMEQELCVAEFDTLGPRQPLSLPPRGAL